MPVASTTLTLDALAPDIVLPDSVGILHRLRDQLGPNGLLVMFMRGFWCSTCAQQLQALRQNYANFEALGFNSMVIMADNPTRVAGSLYADPAPFTVLLDDHREVINLYGVLDPKAFQPETTFNVARPATFILDHAGVIRYLYVGTNLADRPRMVDLLGAAERIAQTAAVTCGATE